MEPLNAISDYRLCTKGTKIIYIQTVVAGIYRAKEKTELF